MDAPEWMKIIILALGTFVSEDLTTIGAGVLASKGSLHLGTALVGCFLGIFIGDGLLYLVGLVIGRPALRLPFLAKMLPEEKVDQCTQWFERNGMSMVIISRFVPGTRLPTYFAAGLLGARARYFLLAAAIAVAIWTPLLIGGAWFFGEQFERYVKPENPYYWLVLASLIVFLFLMVRLLMKLTTHKSRRLLRSRLTRLVRWEFWPILPIYFPVIFYNIWLALRYRSTALPLIANPGIEFSGFIGESKAQIMSGFDDQCEFLAAHHLLPEGAAAEVRLAQLIDWMQAHDLVWPVMLKPDVGQRGDGVHKIENEVEAKNYLTRITGPIQAQEYVPGPYEFGVSYQRLPNEESGRVIGLTGKEFPSIVGDGMHTIEELILALPSGMGRYHIFLERFSKRLGEVLPDGQVLVLARAGNHCLGTIFLDKGHLITPEMEARFDQISRSIPGFFIGRYDIRASDLEAFRKGSSFKVIELNGAAGEPSHMYDPTHSIFFAWRMLFRQYRALWAIGAHNHAEGVQKLPLRTLLKAWRQYRKKSSKG